MRHPIITLLFVALIPLTSCDGLFREIPINKLPGEMIWTDPLLLDEYVLPWYSGMSNGFSVYMPTTELIKNLGKDYLPWYTDQITISRADWFNTAFGDILKGNTTAITRRAYSEWSAWYGAIRSINTLLQNEPKIPDGAQKKRILGEAYFFRGYYHYLLWRRFGGVIIMHEANDPLKGKKQFPRASYDRMVDAITADADKAAQYLHKENAPTDAGRITLGAAKMLKAKTYLWASSEIFQQKEKTYLGFADNQTANMLSKAAAAYEDLFALKQYNLMNVDGTTEQEIALNYRKIFLTKNSPESILEYQVVNDGNIEKGNGHRLDYYAISPYWGGTYAAFTPLQNHVDEYDMRDGIPYDANNPYQNRDYRFYANILHDGCTFRGRTMEIHTRYDGTTATPQADLKPYGADDKAAVSITGYYMGKFVDETQTISITPDKGSKQNYIIWRYAEALLDYAEVKLRQGDPAAALSPVNEIRRRAHMHQLTSITQENYRKERRVEMAFEETVYWDIIRWGEAPQKFDGAITPWKIMRIGIVNNQKRYRIGNYNNEQAKMRHFKPNWIYWPIPWDDIRYHGLEQNPDWREI